MKWGTGKENRGIRKKTKTNTMKRKNKIQRTKGKKGNKKPRQRTTEREHCHRTAGHTAKSCMTQALRSLLSPTTEWMEYDRDL